MNRYFKRFITLTLVILLTLSLFACGGTDTPSGVSPSPELTVTPEETPAPSPSPEATPTPEPTETPTPEPTETPEPTPTPEPSLTVGTWNGTTYTNTAIGLEFTLPSRWAAYTDEELIEFEEENGVLYDYFVYALDYNITVYATLQKLYGGFDGLNMTDAEIRQYCMDQMAPVFEAMGIEVQYDNQADAELAGQTYLYLPLHYPKSLYGIEMTQYIYLSVINDYLMTMTISLTGSLNTQTTQALDKFYAALTVPAEPEE